MKKTLLIRLMAIMAVLALLLTACGQTGTTESTAAETEAAEETTAAPENISITDGIYEETTIGLKTFFRFNEDGSYYGYFFSGGIIEAGTYEVVDKEMEYRAEAGADGEIGTDDDVMATAGQVIVMTTYQGAVNKVAYVDDTILDATLGGMSRHRTLTHNATYEYVPENEELAIAVYTFYANNQAGSCLTLYHDKTFVDYTDMAVEGTWEKTGDNVFTMTTEDGDTWTLTVNDGTAEYVCGDTTVTLSDTIVAEGAATVINTYRVDEAEVGLPMTVGVRIDCYSDSTCKLIVEVAAIGAELEADTGTYELDATLYTPTFHFEKAGDIVSEPDYASATATGIDAAVAYKADVEVEFSGTLTPLSIDAVLTGTASPNAVPTGSASTEKTLFNSVSAADATVDGLPMTIGLRIDMYDDSTCEFIMETAVYTGSDLVMDTGTYELADLSYHPTFHFAIAGDIVSEPDYANATADSLPISVTYAASMEVDPGDGSTATYTFNSVLTGMVVIPS